MIWLEVNSQNVSVGYDLDKHEIEIRLARGFSQEDITEAFDSVNRIQMDLKHGKLLLQQNEPRTPKDSS